MKTENDIAKMPLDGKNSQVNDPAIHFSHQERKVLLQKYRRNFALLTVVIILIFILLLLIIIAPYRSCSYYGNSGNSGSNSDSKNRIFLDNQNRTCFYNKIRLPTDIIPNNYLIYLHPNISQVLSKPTFSGYVVIDCVCKKSTNYIIIHAKWLKLSNSIVEINNGEKAELTVVSFCPSLDQYYLQFRPFCREGLPVKINISFAGIVQKRLDGFYMSDYTTNSGQMKQLATTHMEPTFARQAFPCFDEPYFKSNFSLHMVRDSKHYSLFNMPLKSTSKIGSDLYIDKYYPTVRMSTYLVAYMLLPKDYVYVEAYDDTNRTKIRIYAPKDQKKYTSYALKVSKKTLPFFEEIFGLDYPLPKLDMIAIPDFSAGAMENWGLITYKVIALLISPESKKIQHRSSIAKIISHEIAHQWFGNIVTMDWWNDLWLNEGFASYSEYLGVNHVHKEWKIMEQFFIDQYTDAMNFDSLIHSHPIRVPVNDPHEIESIFDQISYCKGASLVRMLEGILGMPALKLGLSIYLKKYRYRNAVSDNLWDAFSEAYGKLHKPAAVDRNSPMLKLKAVMTTWIDQMNYPLLTIQRTGKNSFEISQERFLIYPDSPKEWTSVYSSKYNYLWYIPILYITDKMKKPKLIWLEMEKVKKFELDHEYKWIKLNYGRFGFYRVQYDDDLFDQLINILNTDINRFSSIDRAGLLMDAFSLVRVGKLNITKALKLSKYLVNEMDFAPWSIATSAFADISKQLYLNIDLTSKFQKFAVSLVEKPMQNSVTNWKNNNLPAYETIVQFTIVKFAIVYRHSQTMKIARQNYEIYKQKNVTTNSNLHNLAMYSAIIVSDKDEWNYLYQKMLNTKDSNSQRLLRTLPKTRNIKLLNKLFITVMNKLKPQDLVSVLKDASQSNAAGIDQAWLFLQRNWAYFERTVAKQYFLISDLFKICNSLMTKFDFEQAKNFFSSKDLGSGARSANQSLERIKSNIYWNEQNLNELKQWLDQNY